MSQLINSTNAEYHNNRSHLSSSGLKLLLSNPSEFHARYILGQHFDDDKPSYADGTLLHSLMLEPELFESQYALFPGLRKAGKLFDDFKVKNSHKKIISVPQLHRAEKWRSSCQSLAPANALLTKGISEYTMLGELMGVKLKARADKIDIPNRVIVDLKTTSAFTDIDVFRQTAADFGYGLSAALYCELAFQTFGELFDFYWVVVSKQDGQCAVYKASSETLLQGRTDITKALVLYKKCLASGLWQHDQPRADFSTNEYEIQEV